MLIWYININDPYSKIPFLWNPRIDKMSLITDPKSDDNGQENNAGLGI